MQGDFRGVGLRVWGLGLKKERRREKKKRGRNSYRQLHMCILQVLEIFRHYVLKFCWPKFGCSSSLHCEGGFLGSSVSRQRQRLPKMAAVGSSNSTAQIQVFVIATWQQLHFHCSLLATVPTIPSFCQENSIHVSERHLRNVTLLPLGSLSLSVRLQLFLGCKRNDLCMTR